ncbi:predicted protein [Naegleria gruberi]|uniref:Predicted protein n=1 Tax=Naegleria gruberi TaxID=5762 RepID=D2VX19_NAEGR|nr:uncharacterized protein NAEGRDRAFT_73586 [Naegleria gruberi]EFC38544.1 predicted protein [Naegleria gruberi]|eukprot:XP_002671288.1 predicted protein [Naegleria gruberi strain NEG-M]
MSEEQIHHLAQFYKFISNNNNQLVGVENNATTNDNNFIQYNIAILDSIVQSIASNSNMYQAYDWNQLYLYLSYKIHHIRQIYPNNQENFDNLMQSIDSNLRKFNR